MLRQRSHRQQARRTLRPYTRRAEMPAGFGLIPMLWGCDSEAIPRSGVDVILWLANEEGSQCRATERGRGVGPDCPIDCKPPSGRSRLDDTLLVALAVMIESGPISPVHGVLGRRIVEWR